MGALAPSCSLASVAQKWSAAQSALSLWLSRNSSAPAAGLEGEAFEGVEDFAAEFFGFCGFSCGGVSDIS